jgi:hypothetical protein
MPQRNANKNIGKLKLPLVSKIGLGLVLVALLFAVLNYIPIVSQEVDYVAKHSGSPFGLFINKSTDPGKESSSSASLEITPIDTNFGIVVSKIGANTRVVADVNPTDSYAYQVALTKG